MLTDKQIKALKAKDKRYSKADSNGLSINVMPTGKKSWVLEYAINGKRKRVKLGEYPHVSLREAREQADNTRNNSVSTDITTHELVQKWLTLYSKQWKSDKYKKTVKYRLNYIIDALVIRM